MKTALIVDDDDHIREVLRFALTKAGFRIIEAADGVTAVERFQSEAPDVVILDILMPEMDGTEVCKAIRKGARTPIIFLSSCDEETDRIVGLELGGDDYVNKPFSPRELVARVKAVMRRSEPDAPAAKSDLKSVTTHGDLTLDPNFFKAVWRGADVPLTATEFYLLAALLGYPGKVYSRSELMDKAYDENLVVTDRTIDSHVRRLRKKFAAVGADPIETVHGVGYKVTPCR